jgi:hypothetical protein
MLGWIWIRPTSVTNLVPSPIRVNKGDLIILVPPFDAILRWVFEAVDADP